MKAAVAGFLMLFASSAWALADLETTMVVSKTHQIALGNELLVSLTVRNLGPDDASNVSLGGGQATQEEFLYTLIGSTTPECGEVEEFITDPPTYSFDWTVPLLPSGESITCVARVRVARLPNDLDSVLYGGTIVANDPDLSNNFTQQLLMFSALVGRLKTVPSLSESSLLVLAIGVLWIVARRSLAR